ncbi:hypothetical protein V7094_28130 [Priestia megaterium]|uniref:hypothetical protein n=1 Tax=Priestia megaterium TaxID=1404 RepID=UPI0030003E1F
MLYKRLSDLYKENEILSEEFPLDEYFPLLQNFISREVDLGAEYLSPYRFSLFFSKPTKEILRFFLGLTDSENIVEQHYKYECDECRRINIIKDEESLIHFKCKNCGSEDSLVTSDYLSEVKLLFKLNEELLEDFRENLKYNPLPKVSESSSTVLEGGGDIEFTLESVEEVIYKNDKPISKKSEERAERLDLLRRIL